MLEGSDLPITRQVRLQLLQLRVRENAENAKLAALIQSDALNAVKNTPEPSTERMEDGGALFIRSTTNYFWPPSRLLIMKIVSENLGVIED